ncbi:hypothetical protein CC77DRAFT_191214 [Alternaria alternata]|uniref:Uncharacterized protein n=1 Tax=Alternaria alternata TaxID=5599 RepID=A0A177DH83_ALTAL|nr:hypothetical protein CC77DRAFT_191214 [Alternaria alternata]OAG18452.1 hypothetical protein CC77DRAFT_191214 [Alternaria alternata]
MPFLDCVMSLPVSLCYGGWSTAVSPNFQRCQPYIGRRFLPRLTVRTILVSFMHLDRTWCSRGLTTESVGRLLGQIWPASVARHVSHSEGASFHGMIDVTTMMDLWRL